MNKYGDNTFCHFRLNSHLSDKGIYIWVANGEIKYLGKFNDNFKKRVNQGYGKINPKNCFVDGQATNCHLNSEINKIENVEFYVHKMNNKNKSKISMIIVECVQASFPSEKNITYLKDLKIFITL